MWYWYLLGYVFTGAIAIIGSGTWFVMSTPKRNGYEFGHWIDHVADLIDDIMGPQTRIENVLGTLESAFLWPIKVVWLVRVVYPEVVERYEELLILEKEEP